MLPVFSSLLDIINWLVGPGALVVSGFFVAYVLERLTFWHSVPKNLKVLVTLALAYVVSWASGTYLNVETVLNNDGLNDFVNFILYYYSNQVAYTKYFKVA